MKLQLETIQYPKSASSFHFFKREERHFSSYRHFHPELELTYIERGTGIRYVGDHIATFSAGDLVLIGPNLPHDYVSTVADGAYAVAYVFQFPSHHFINIPEGKALRQLFAEADRGLYFYRPSPSILDLITSITSTPSLENFNAFLQLLSRLQNDLARRQLSSITFSNNVNKGANNSKISRVTKYIAEQFQQPISVEQMAQLTSMTAPSFCRWFKQTTGSSFVTYLNATRIEKACQQLVYSHSPIAQIGFAVGFETVGHFNRTFKRFKKQTPREYRKRFLTSPPTTAQLSEPSY